MWPHIPTIYRLGGTVNNYISKCNEMIEHSEWYWKCEHAFIFTCLLLTSFASNVSIHNRKATQKSYLVSVQHNFLIIKNLRSNISSMYYTHYLDHNWPNLEVRLQCKIWEKVCGLFPTALCIQFHNDVLVPPAEIATHTFFPNKVVAFIFYTL